MAKQQYNEIGTSGLPAFGGYITAAHIPQLRWPACLPDYERIRRSDPEIAGIVRQAFARFAGQQNMVAQPPEKPTPVEQKATDFLNEMLDELLGGTVTFLDTYVNYAPFMGWAWFETPLGLRRRDWHSPNDDGWETRHNDGLIVIRSLAFRNPTSWESWDIGATDKRLRGMWQNDAPNPSVLIPLDRSLHLTFGDSTSPEGWSPLEAVYRLERYKYNLELVYGIGSEHSAGYAKFTIKEELDASAKALIRNAARAILAAQEGNYITEIADKFEANIIDTPFAAAENMLEAIRYYGLLKLQVYNMQWVTIATTANTGAYAASSNASEMGIMSYNGMMDGMARQMSRQLIPRILRHPMNAAAFAGIERYPQFVVPPIEQSIPLNELGAFLTSISPIVPLDDNDIVAIRRKSGFLPVPEGELQDEETDQPQPEAEPEPVEDDGNGGNDDMAELAQGLPTSAVDEQLETKEANELRRLLLLALLDQYRGANIKTAVRDNRAVDVLELDAISQAVKMPALSDELDTGELLRLLALFANNGRRYGQGQANRTLTPAELLTLERGLTDYAARRAASLLGIENGGTGRIDDPLLHAGLDAESLREVSRLVRQAIYEARALGSPSIQDIMSIYDRLLQDAVGIRVDGIVTNEVGTLFNAGHFLAVVATQPQTKTWLETISKHPRTIHLEQVGVTVRMDERFPDGSYWAGELPNCKCGILVGY